MIFIDIQDLPDPFDFNGRKGLYGGFVQLVGCINTQYLIGVVKPQAIMGQPALAQKVSYFFFADSV